MAIGQEPSKLAAAKHASSKLTVTARYSDIDVNEHVNSARYIAWIVDSYPLEHHQHHELKLIELNYLGETRGGSAISICSEESAPGEWSHSLVRPDGAEVCRARARWSSTTGARPSSDAGIPD
jgi:acyl-ACP thioesterase